MKKVFIILALFVGGVAWADDFSCGAGYVLDKHPNIDGIPAMQCKKLWCRDLETDAVMGTGDKVASGYQETSAPVELCDAAGHCIECWGQRRWCAGDVRGEWNPEYGMYTRGGADSVTYRSYKKGGCFSWRLEQHNCPDGEVAVLKDGEWVCATSSTGQVGTQRTPVLRRTGAVRR